MPVQLQKIAVSNFGPFMGDHECSFPPHGLVQVRGLNRQTGGSSGAGKSSFLTAVGYALGHSSVPSAAIQCWETDKKPQVRLVLGTDSGAASISRGVKTFFEDKDGQTKGAVAIVEERLRAAIGTDPEVLKLLTYRGQKQPSQFLGMNDAAKKEFLAQILGLDKIESAYEDSLKKEKVLEGRLAQQQLTVKAIQLPFVPVYEAVDTTPIVTTIEELKQKQSEVERQIKSLSARIKKLNDEVPADSEAVLDCQKQLEKERAATFSQDLAHLNKLRTFEKEIERRLNGFQAEDDRRLRIFTKRKQEKEQVLADAHRLWATVEDRRAEVATLERALAEKKCPTCKQSLELLNSGDEGLWTEILNITLKLKATRDRLNEAEDAEGRIHWTDMQILEMGKFEPNPKIQQFQGSLAEARRQIGVEQQRLNVEAATFESERRSRIAAIEKQIAELRVENRKGHTAALRELNEQSVALYEQRRLITEELAHNENRLSTHRLAEVNHQAAIKALDTATARLAEEKRRLDEIDLELRAERDFSRFVGRDGFLGVIFDEVLKEIEEQANKNLGRIPNTAQVSVIFKSEVSSQKGNVKKAIVTEFTKNGHKCSHHGLSGGMQTVVDLAVDLSLLEVAGRRTGIRPGWLVLDEAMQGLGLVEKEACLELLQRFGQEKLVLVVDHDTAFKEFFTKTIDISYDGAVSSISESETGA